MCDAQYADEIQKAATWVSTTYFLPLLAGVLDWFVVVSMMMMMTMVEATECLYKIGFFLLFFFVEKTAPLPKIAEAHLFFISVFNYFVARIPVRSPI